MGTYEEIQEELKGILMDEPDPMFWRNVRGLVFTGLLRLGLFLKIIEANKESIDDTTE